MNLIELNEKYDEYNQTEEYYLEEGLKLFKKSKRLYTFSERIDKKITKAEKQKKVSPYEITKLKKLSSSLVKLADEYKVIEDEFAKGKSNRKISKEKVKRINRNNETLLNMMKKNETKQAFKAIGLGAIAVAITAILAQLGVNFNVISKVGGFFVKTTKTALPVPTFNVVK